MGVPPSGRRVRLTGVDLATVEDGRIRTHWSGEELAGLLKQVGALRCRLPRDAPASGFRTARRARPRSTASLTGFSVPWCTCLPPRTLRAPDAAGPGRGCAPAGRRIRRVADCPGSG